MLVPVIVSKNPNVACEDAKVGEDWEERHGLTRKPGRQVDIRELGADGVFVDASFVPRTERGKSPGQDEDAFRFAGAAVHDVQEGLGLVGDAVASDGGVSLPEVVKEDDDFVIDLLKQPGVDGSGVSQDGVRVLAGVDFLEGC